MSTVYIYESLKDLSDGKFCTRFVGIKKISKSVVNGFALSDDCSEFALPANTIMMVTDLGDEIE